MVNSETKQSLTKSKLKELVLGMEKHCLKQLELCNSLEDIADSLPDDVDPQDCLHTARALYPAVKSAHEFEENVLFPVLDEIKKSDAALESSLERLRYEHWEDESYAQELTDVLMDWAKGDKSRNPETTGYMLRGFFEGIRRHIAFEGEHIIPKVRQMLINTAMMPTNFILRDLTLAAGQIWYCNSFNIALIMSSQ